MHVQENTNEAISEPIDEAIPQQAPDAVDLLLAQHREIFLLFDALQNSGESKRHRERAVLLLASKIKVHLELEEKIFYPATKRTDLAANLESIEEHANIKAMLRKMLNADTADKTFHAKIVVLKEMMTAHINKEETIVFGKVKEVLSHESLVQMAMKMQDRITTKKSSVPTRRQKASQRRRAAARTSRTSSSRKKKSRLH